MTSFKNSENLFWRIIFPVGILFAMAMQFISTYCGLGITSDSLLYLEGADYFRNWSVGSLKEQEVFQSKPPLFPLFLSLFSQQVLPYVYALLMLLNLFVLAKILTKVQVSILVQTVSFFALAAFTPFVMVHVYLWTEPLFNVLLYSAILILIYALSGKLTNRSLIVLALLGILMVLTKHVGLFFLAGIALAMAIIPAIGWKRAAVIFGAGLIVFAIWNFGLMSEGMSGRITTFKSPVSGGTWNRLKNIDYFLDAASTWLLPKSINKWGRVGVLIILAAALLYFGRNQLMKSSILKTLLIISLTYYLLMHINFLIDKSDADRYLLPIYPLVLIAVMGLLERMGAARKKWLMIILFLWMLYPFSRTIKNAVFWKEKICFENNTVMSKILKDNSQLSKD